jgi:hypothetical protein
MAANDNEHYQEMRAETIGLLNMMAEDGLPIDSTVWTGEYRYTDSEESGMFLSAEDIAEEPTMVATWYQFRDKAGIIVWVTFNGDGYYMLDAEEFGDENEKVN